MLKINQYSCLLTQHPSFFLNEILIGQVIKGHFNKSSFKQAISLTQFSLRPEMTIKVMNVGR